MEVLCEGASTSKSDGHSIELASNAKQSEGWTSNQITSISHDSNATNFFPFAVNNSTNLKVPMAVNVATNSQSLPVIPPQESESLF
jgi:hypothetical protein